MTYTELWSVVQRECTQRNLIINVRHLVVDFERPVLNTFELVFGVQVSKHFFFHLTQSTWIKVQELGLVVAFNTDTVFKEFVAMIDALAFWPINDVTAGMAYLQRNVYPNPQATTLLHYFDRIYVNSVARNIQVPHGQAPVVQMHPPVFPPAIWNVHNATLNNHPRMNNVCESWNNSYCYLVCHHQCGIQSKVSKRITRKTND